MTERKLLTLDDFVTKPTTYTRFGQKVTKNPIQQIYDAGLLSEYKQLTVSHKYLRFSGMFEEGDGAEGIYFQDNSITDDEDIGVIIYIGENKYRRLWGAYVLVDWFYTGDFGIALQRACNYASVRCIPGKTYECNSSITMKLNTKSIAGYHGATDYGHVLIDLRGATINYTAENTSFCFNIRIYHRDTKFMLTNGTFNVSDSAKLTLKNIANIIGGNNYTDMLTDMTYNVESALQPDTNRVVLVTDPTMEGIKTFKSLNYVGDAVSGDDNQAVTKEYTVSNSDSDYLPINNTNALNILRFDSYIDVGTSIVKDLTKITDKLYDVAASQLAKVTNNIFLAFTYVVSIEENQEYLEYDITDTYKVYKVAPYDIIFNYIQQEVDEGFVGSFIYDTIVTNKPISINKTDLQLVDCPVVAQLPNININKYLEFYSVYPVSFQFVGSVTYEVYDDSFPVPQENIKYMMLHEGVLTIYTKDNKWKTYAYYNYGGLFYSYNVDIYEPKANNVPVWLKQKYPSALIIPIYTNTINAAIIVHNYSKTTGYAAGRYRTGYKCYTLSYPYSSNVTTELVNLSLINAVNNKVYEITTNDLRVINTNIINGSEYISIVNTPKLYLPIDAVDTIEGDVVETTVLYAINASIVQANLAKQDGITVKPTCSYKSNIYYNGDSIPTNIKYLYIPRFLTDDPRSESTTLQQYTYKYKDYFCKILFTNPTLTTLYYNNMYINLHASNKQILPAVGSYSSHLQERDGSGCQCYTSGYTYRHASVTGGATCIISYGKPNSNTLNRNVACYSMHREKNIVGWANYNFTIEPNVSKAYGDIIIISPLVTNMTAANVKWDDVTEKTISLSVTETCGKCTINGASSASLKGIANSSYAYVTLYCSKANLFDRVLGKDGWGNQIYRDGIFTGKIKDRHMSSNYATSAAIYALNPGGN